MKKYKYRIEFISDEKMFDYITKLVEVTKDCYITEAKKVPQTRTSRQNRAIHLWFTQVANELNEKGLDMRAVLKKDLPIRWSKESVKEHLWRTVQKTLLGKTSTTKLKRHEVDEIYNYLVDALTIKSNGMLEIPPFPNKYFKQYD